MNNSQQEYQELLSKYQSGVTGPEAVGKVIATFGQYFSDVNLAYGSTLKAYNLKYAELIQETEENGKNISAAKAQILVDATPEGIALIDAKVNRDIIEKQINTLCSFQKGVMSEWVKGGNM